MEKLTVYELREIIRAMRENAEYIAQLERQQPRNCAINPDFSIKLLKHANKLESFINQIEIKA